MNMVKPILFITLLFQLHIFLKIDLEAVRIQFRINDNSQNNYKVIAFLTGYEKENPLNDNIECVLQEITRSNHNDYVDNNPINFVKIQKPFEMEFQLVSADNQSMFTKSHIFYLEQDKGQKIPGWLKVVQKDMFREKLSIEEVQREIRHRKNYDSNHISYEPDGSVYVRDNFYAQRIFVHGKKGFQVAYWSTDEVVKLDSTGFTIVPVCSEMKDAICVLQKLIVKGRFYPNRLLI